MLDLPKLLQTSLDNNLTLSLVTYVLQCRQLLAPRLEKAARTVFIYSLIPFTSQFIGKYKRVAGGWEMCHECNRPLFPLLVS